jgi:CDGSH-type Zn-finger protein
MCKDAIVFLNKPQGIQLEAGKVYSYCMCGRSKDGVFCDGSHEGTSCTPKTFSVEKTKAYHLCRCKSSKNLPFCDGTHSFYSDDDVGKNVTV